MVAMLVLQCFGEGVEVAKIKQILYSDHIGIARC